MKGKKRGLGTKPNNLTPTKTKAKSRGGPKTPEQKKKMLEDLKELFLQDGMTAYQASENTPYDYKTVKAYFNEWADEIIEHEGHENWIQREKRVRARALEGTSKKLTAVKKRLAKFTKILDDLLDIRAELDKDADTIDKKVLAIIDSLDSKEYERLNQEIEDYERIVRLNDILSFELQQQYDAIEMIPPAEAILDREIEKHIAEKQAAFTKTDSTI